MSSQKLIEMLGYDLASEIIESVPDDSAQYVFFYAANPQSFKFGKVISAERYLWLEQCKRWGEHTLRSSYSAEYDSNLTFVHLTELRAAIDKCEADSAEVKESKHWEMVLTLGCSD